MGNIFTNSGKTIGADIRTEIRNLKEEIEKEEDIIRKINGINDTHGLEGNDRHEFNKFLQNSLKKDKETLEILETEKAQRLLSMMKGIINRTDLHEIDEITRMINGYMESTQRGKKKKKKKKKKNNKRNLSTRATKSTRSSLRRRN